MVTAIAAVSSPHPAALRASTLRRRDQGRALLPWMLRYQMPTWPEHSLTRHDAAELERIVGIELLPSLSRQQKELMLALPEIRQKKQRN